MDDQVRGLIFFVLGARVIEVGELVEGEFAVALRCAEQMSFGAAIRRQFGQLAHVLVAGTRRIAVAQAAPAGNHLQPGVEHAGVESVLESLVHVANFPELFLDPGGFDFLLKLAQSRRG